MIYNQDAKRKEKILLNAQLTPQTSQNNKQQKQNQKTRTMSTK